MDNIKFRVLVVSIFVLVSMSLVPIFHAENKCFDNDVDVGIGQPCSINGGDVFSTGENSFSVTVFNHGDAPSNADFEHSFEKLEGFNWSEVDSGTNGPYELDPEAWVESFFDVCMDVEGEYRATFTLLNPITHEPWIDDNPENDVYQVVFSVRQNAENDIFVDDDANSGGDGSASAPFSSITEALTKAIPGDCIRVAEGFYQGNLQIETPSLTITCDCDNPGLTSTIDGGGTRSVITLSADWVTITGFVITNSGNNEEDAAIDITSNHNMISWNTVEDNGGTGIYLHNSAQSNYIHHNIIRNNDGAGIFIWEQSISNRIYHNDFIANEWYHVKDKEGGNIWNYDSIYGGNYWDDYPGDDTNSDGIGEVGYDILGDYGSMGVDLYPWVNPHGWNNPPKTPMISGKTSGKTGESYTYNLTIGDEHFEPGSEPFEEHVYCRVDWGDDTEEYYGPVHLSNLNDVLVSVSHQWDMDGSYIIRTKIIDAYGLESDWGTLQVSMPKEKSFRCHLNDWLFNHPFLDFLIQRILTA
jgi:parallel beta-helix repeat protein